MEHVSFHSLLLIWIQRHADILELVPWDAWSVTTQQKTTDADQAWLDVLGDKAYMMAVSPWFYTSLTQFNKNWLWKGDSLWYTRWEQVLDVLPDFVEVRNSSFFSERFCTILRLRNRSSPGMTMVNPTTLVPSTHPVLSKVPTATSTTCPTTVGASSSHTTYPPTKPERGTFLSHKKASPSGIAVHPRAYAVTMAPPALPPTTLNISLLVNASTSLSTLPACPTALLRSRF